jgi:RNA polymerase sigma-70 factor (ECF subfamily)
MNSISDWHLERYRPLLCLQVRHLQRDPRLLSRFDSSDVVQDALLKAHENLPRFRGGTEAELVKWLQEILANVLTDKVRHEHAGKRDVTREQRLQAAFAESSARLEKYLEDKQPSPSEQVDRQDLLLRIATAIEQLPEDQRDVVIRRDLSGATVAEIAKHLGRTEKSVAGLLLRGRRRLRELLSNDQ